MDDGDDDPELEDMIAARSRVTPAAFGSHGLMEDHLVYGIDGTAYTPAMGAAYFAMLPGGTGRTLRELNLSNALVSPFGGMLATRDAGEAAYNALPLANRSANNLGGLGPNNGTYCYRRAALNVGPYAGACDPGNYQAHPNFIRMNDVVEVAGRRVAMRIDNTSEFLVAKPAMNDFNGFNFQVNLAPIYDPYGGDPARSAAHDPFRDTSVPYGNLINQFIESALKVNLGQENSNAVSLFYSLFHQDDGSPVELSEVRTPSLPLPPRLSPR